MKSPVFVVAPASARSKQARWTHLAILLLILALLGHYTVQAAQVALAWDPTNDAAGYRVYYGNQSGVLDHVLVAGSATRATVSGLAEGVYYFAVAAYSQDGLQSAPSDEVSATITAAPQLLQVSLTSPQNGEQMNGPRSITLTAEASPAPGQAIATVEFFANAQKIGASNSSPYAFTWPNVQSGNYTFSAKAWTATGESATSQAATVSMTELRVNSLRVLPQGAGVEFIVEAAPNSTNEIYASSDLIHWTLIGTAVNSTGLINVQDPEAATATRRFYKVKAH